jgi:hypothetical protein
MYNGGMEQGKAKHHLREIVPHAGWRAIEWFWDLARAAIVAALIALRQWFLNHWDLLTISIVFIALLALLIWRDVSVARKRLQANRIHEQPNIGEIGLDIRSALYGAGHKGLEDIDITDTLRQRQHNALACLVCNDLAPRDPAIGTKKRIEVKYSFWNQTVKTVVRAEDQMLVLPEFDAATQCQAVEKVSAGAPSIRGAVYGSDSIHVDVIQRVRSMIADPKYKLADGRIAIPVNNDLALGHDPHVGVYKYLKVSFSKTAH